MIINLEKQKEFPFGNNIHFAYDLSAKEFLFVHPSLKWVISRDQQQSALSSLISKIHPDDMPMLRRALSKIKAGKFQGCVKFKLLTSATERWLQVIPFLAEHSSSDLLLGNVIDITDEVANYESINKYANKKNSILYMLSHDLRGPLNMAKSVIGVMDREISDTGLLKKIQYIKSIIQLAIDLINNLINRELLETAEIVLVKKRVDIVQKLTEYIEECRRSADLAQRTFNFSCSAERIFMELDLSKFMQVVNNLFSNSMKFTRPGGSISVTVSEEESFIRFEFADDGIGIPKEHLTKIFEKFTSVRRPGLSGEPTLGLGLSIVKTIIDWHSGKIWCESEEGKGTVFYINLPKQSPA